MECGGKGAADDTALDLSARVGTQELGRSIWAVEETKAVWRCASWCSLRFPPHSICALNTLSRGCDLKVLIQGSSASEAAIGASLERSAGLEICATTLSNPHHDFVRDSASQTATCSAVLILAALGAPASLPARTVA